LDSYFNCSLGPGHQSTGNLYGLGSS